MAILSSVLAGFVGLVIDVGGVTSEHERAQSAADGAALAAAQDLAGGATLAAATAYAQAVLASEDITTSALTLTFRDSSGAVTATAASVSSVDALVSFSYATRFLPVLGISSTPVSAGATASVPGRSGNFGPCGLCAMATSGSIVSLGNGATVTVRGNGVYVDSTSNPNVTLNGSATLTATFITLAASHLGGGGTATPTPTVGAPIADPLAGLAVPAVAGVATAYSTPLSGSGSLSPGVYSSITVNGTYALTLNPGTYVLEGQVKVNGGSLTGNGVTLYLTCPGYPVTTCGGAAGASLSLPAGTTTLTAPSSGTYQGVVVFADRTNTATNTLGGGALSTTGTFYTIAMPWNDTARSTAYTLSSELIVQTFTVANGGTVTINYSNSQNAPGQAGSSSAASLAVLRT